MVDGPFSVQLREASWPHHRRAEHTEYLKALVTGRVDSRGYAAMVAQHWYAYVALEEAGRTLRHDPVAGRFWFAELERVPALERDLHALLGPQWNGVIAPSEATARYVERIRAVCFTWPAAFVAHHYTRYLGDLSGGQYLAKAVQRCLGLDHSTGTAFYDFSHLRDLDAFKDDYRRHLDAVEWSPGDRERFIAETNYAYYLNTEVLVQLVGEVVDNAGARQ